MSISVSDLFANVVQEIGAGYASDRLTSSFPSAVNRALDDLAVTADAATKFTHITSTDGTISLSENYEYILYAGVIYYLIRMGHRPADPKIAAVIYQDSAERWREGKADYVMDLDNVRQATDTNSMIGWGYLGTDTSSSDT